MLLLAPVLVWLAATLGSIGLPNTVYQAANDLKIESPTQQSAKPGDYVTLGFNVSGTGTYTFQLEAPEGWEPLSNNKSLTLDGPRSVAFSLRVPLEALADQTAVFTLKAVQGERVVASITGSIRVLAVGGVRMRAPDEVRTRPGDAAQFELFVTNTGNRADTFRLSPQRSIWRVNLEPQAFALNVGETRTVKVTLVPQGQISSGYIYVLRLRGESSLSSDAVSEIQVLFRFGKNGSERSSTTELETELNVRFSVTPSVTLPPYEAPVFGLNIGVSPGLSGQLSDFVTGTLDTSGSGFGLDLQSGFSLPSGFNLGLRSVNWDAALRFSGNDTELSISYAWKDWLLGGSVGYSQASGAQRLRFGSTLTSLRDELNLQLYASFSGTSGATVGGDGRSDSIGVTYGLPLSQGLSLSLGTDLTGSTTAGSPYTIGLSLNESLRWQTEALEVFQSYSGVPFSGQHGLSLFAGLRNTAPFGLRGGSSLSFTLGDPVQFTWRNTVIANASVLSGLNFFVTGSYGIVTSPSYLIDWSVGALGSYNFLIPGILFGGLNAAYTHTGVIVGNAPERDSLTLGGQISSGNFSAGVNAGFAVSSATGNTARVETTTASTQLSYLFSSATGLYGQYDYKLEVADTAREQHSLTFGWAQVWSASLSTTVAYTRTLTADFVNPNQQGDALGVGVLVQDLFTEGLSLSFGWQWSAANGSIFDGSVASQHRFSLSLGFTVNLPFVTPAPITEIFGGRRSGEIRGVAYLDTNLNGKRDPDEPALKNVTLRLGRNVTATTDANGNYSLRAPVGQYSFDFPSGLEAGLDLIGERTVNIVLNQTETRDLAFAPVTSLEVSLFDDANNNGKRDANEIGIAYGGVRLEGPISKQVRVDGDGNATVSGLVSGLYTVVPDPRQLPEGYRSTTAPVEVTVKTPDAPAPVTVGAALPPRIQETTFEAGNLSVFANAEDTTLPAGGDLKLEALTQGKVDRVTAKLGDLEITLLLQDGRYLGTLRLPKDIGLGGQTVVVTAFSGTQQVSFEVSIIVTNTPLFSAGNYKAQVNTEISFELLTFYKIPAGDLELVFPDGQRLKLETTDGYTWRGRWRAPATSGRIEARLEDKGTVLGTVNFAVVLPTTELLWRGFLSVLGI